jgi:hypothetical protein
MAGPFKTRQLGHACRIYKNSSDKVIAIDDISVSFNIQTLPKSNTEIKYHRSAEKPDVDRTLFYLGEGNRVVSKIQMIGNFSSIEENSGNYHVVTWDAASSDENDVIISIEPHVSQVGDTV